MFKTKIVKEGFIMYCNNCGSEMPSDAKFCPVCGSPAQSGGQSGEPNAAYRPYVQNASYASPPKSRLLAGILALLFGGIGVHNFYLGNTTRAVIQIVVSLVTCGLGSIWGFVEGILILCRQINVDGYGNPLKDDC